MSSPEPAFFLFLGASGVYGLLIGWLLRGWLKLPSFRVSPYKVQDEREPRFVSVILPVRNEVRNIPRIVEDLNEQVHDRRCFEVIVVDDHSEDTTAALLEQKRKEVDITLRVGYNEQAKTGKKQAIVKGVEMAEGELIVTTDADCSLPKYWLHTIEAFYVHHGEPGMIIMPVLHHEKRGILSSFQSLDLLSLTGVTAGSASNGWPLLANGANLAYRKSDFLMVGAFQGNEAIPSGDDVFLLQSMKKAKVRIRYLLSLDVLVHTPVAPTIKAFLAQRARWAGKAGAFRDPLALLIPLFSTLFSFLLLGGLLSMSFSSNWSDHVLLGLCIKGSLDAFFLFLLASYFQKRSLLKFLVPGFMIHLFYLPFVGLWSAFVRPEWKGRPLK